MTIAHTTAVYGVQLGVNILFVPRVVQLTETSCFMGLWHATGPRGHDNLLQHSDRCVMQALRKLTHHAMPKTVPTWLPAVAAANA